MDRLDQIRRKLDTLGSYDIEECADLDLGIRKHGFRIEPPLPESEVIAFEQRYGILLPPEYRTWWFAQKPGQGLHDRWLSPLSIARNEQKANLW